MHSSLNSAGVWVPKQIPNPLHFKDENPYQSVAPMVALAVEVWTTDAAILFDNFAVSHSQPAVLAFAEELSAPKGKAERRAAKQQHKERVQQEREEMLQHASLTDWAKIKAEQLLEFLKENPWYAIYTVIAVILALVYFLLCGTGNGGSSSTGGKREKKDKTSEPESVQVADSTSEKNEKKSNDE